MSKESIVKILSFFFTLLIWQGLSYFRVLGNLVFSPPSAALPKLYSLILNGTLLHPLLNTFSEFFAGMALAIIVGVPCGMILGMFETVRRIANPYLNILNSTPKSAVLPLFLLFLGFTSFQSTYTFGAFMAIFPIIILIRGAVENSRQRFVVEARVMGASSFQIFAFVLVPLVARNIVSALRIGSSLIMLGVILKELFAQTVLAPGIGSLIITYSNSFQTSAAYGLIFLLAMITILINEILFFIEKRTSTYLS